MCFDVASFQQAFFEETVELLDGFEEHLLRLEESPDDLELLKSIFRCAHSIKGGAATFGFPDLARFTHCLETLLDGVRNKRVHVTSNLCRVLLDALDQMRALLAVAKGEDAEAPDSDALIARLEAAATSEPDSPRTEAVDSCIHDTGDGEGEAWGLLSEPQIFEVTFKPSYTCLLEGSDPILVLSDFGKAAPIISSDCDTSEIPGFDDLDPEKCFLSWSLMVHTDLSEAEITGLLPDASTGCSTTVYQLGGTPEEKGPEISATTQAPKPTTSEAITAQAQMPTAQHGAAPVKDGGTIKVSADKLDRLINLVGELIISQSMLNSVTENFELGKLPQLLEAVALMERSSRELQERVMGMRLLQIKMAFGRFPRMVHDLSSAIGKKIELKLVGEETELDKNLIETIGDPLTHLIRNSVDHGLETPSERIAAGKPEVGTLTVSAFHEGGNIVIEVADDGKGLSHERILKKAIEKGLVGPDESLTEDQICNLIFQPGFSTAEKVTDLSGRGVGMDIVKQAITSIGGTIKVSTVTGKGTATRIRLPLTMAILDGQSMAVGDNVYIVPLTSILESIRPTENEVHEVAGLGEVVCVRGEYIPIVRLHKVFDVTARTNNPWEGSLVLVECEGKKVALFVDDLMGQGQVVIKSLETNYRKVDGIAGATILGDGRVALIVDIPGLVRGIREDGVTPKVAA